MIRGLLLSGLIVLGFLSPADAASPSAKKGIGLAERKGLGAAQIEALRVSWYYNWGSQTALRTGAQFVPMIFSARRLEEAVTGGVVLGFNEPDHPKQANHPVEVALAAWERVAAKAPLVGSPAMAGDPVRSLWFRAFMEARPRVDFITFHWYKGADSRRFIRDLEAVHAAYGLPIWVTEYAPQGAADGEARPERFPQEQVDAFIRETVVWMESTPWIERYAWHDAKKGTSALFAADGSLTATGRTYASVP